MSSSNDRRRRGATRKGLTAELLRPLRSTTKPVVLRPGQRSPAFGEGLSEQDDLHRLACEAGRTGSWYVRLDNQECVLSSMAASLLGLPAEEIVLPAELWRRHVDPDHLGGLESLVRLGIQQDRPFDLEFRATRPDGTEYWLYARGGVVRDAQGIPTRVHGALVDLTEHKRAKDELARLNETLEQRVAERTAELLQAQEALRQSQKLESLGQLTGGIAHDFNNLLTPIIAALDRLQQSAGSDASDRRVIDVAVKSADSARLLVQRLLAFARRQPLQPVCVDVGERVRGMMNLLARTLGPHIMIEVEIEEDLEHALADPNQLEMAILNLSVNARDAMRSGGTLRLAVTNDEVKGQDRFRLAPGRYIRLTVTDTGTGMDEATRARAIDPFFSTKEVGEGTGLGLSMCHGLALQLGGALELASEVGHGTRVDLWLPIWTGAVEEKTPTPNAGAAATGEGIVLLVDDHDLVRLSTAEMLRELGYEVVEATSGEEAVRLFGDGLRPRLVIADHLMPGMTGTDLARLLRGRCPQTAFLLVSGYAGAEGATPDLPCLTKPFRKSELQAAIAAVNKGAWTAPDRLDLRTRRA